MAAWAQAYPALGQYGGPAHMEPVQDLTGPAHTKPRTGFDWPALVEPARDLTGLDWEPGTRFTDAH